MRPLHLVALALWAVLAVVVAREVFLTWRSGRPVAAPKPLRPAIYRAAGTIDGVAEVLPVEPRLPTVVAFVLLTTIAVVPLNPYDTFARLGDVSLPVCGQPCPGSGGDITWALMGAGSSAIFVRLLPALLGGVIGLVLKGRRPASAMRHGRFLLGYAALVVLAIAASVGVRIARGGAEPAAFTELGGLTGRGAARVTVEQAVARRANVESPPIPIGPSAIPASRLPRHFPPLPSSLCCAFGEFRDGRGHPDWGVRIQVAGKPQLLLAENGRITYWAVPDLPPEERAAFESPLVARFEAMPAYRPASVGFIVVEDRPGMAAPHALLVYPEEGSQTGAAERPGDVNAWPCSAIEVGPELAIPRRTQVSVALALAVIALTAGAALARRRLAWSGAARAFGAWLALELALFAFTQMQLYS